MSTYYEGMTFYGITSDLKIHRCTLIKYSEEYEAFKLKDVTTGQTFACRKTALGSTLFMFVQDAELELDRIRKTEAGQQPKSKPKTRPKRGAKSKNRATKRYYHIPIPRTPTKAEMERKEAKAYKAMVRGERVKRIDNILDGNPLGMYEASKRATIKQQEYNKAHPKLQLKVLGKNKQNYKDDD